jgi:hypothetical protein
MTDQDKKKASPGNAIEPETQLKADTPKLSLVVPLGRLAMLPPMP